ncbi:hypothetical protein [Flavobacterium sp.]|uniref:hypothetical protein n=1 Tax=Flavobacterium sp. TaxID=239 RepID=UPI0040485E2F
MATFLKSGPRDVICPTCTVSVIGIKTAINIIEAIFVLNPRSNEMPAISITIPHRITAVSSVPRIFPIKPLRNFLFCSQFFRY